ncbi:5'-methylthioadenosine/S-adenosylhomocysteine nucleosidase family protein [Chryseobacterium hagamense]|uniref:Uncharacterized protein n=1 Tax=Chryseobacterium hagamense TaxID=395935 RepID=A0A511YRS4_9FLAO|nr:AAA family ATPase [Chryseobacterium hagamense]GEN77898.1 hypothetical protein CHA01nite_36380 [Chryseobacterium hagamense]
MSQTEYLELDFDKIKHLIDDNIILLATATELETEFTHKTLQPLSKYSKVVKFYYDNFTYYLGVFGKYKVVHVQCSMGSLSPSSSIITISKALVLLKSKVVLMIGIAFGVDSDKQNIGDVLVAESIIPYDSKRVGTDTIIQRGKEIQSSQLLLNRFKNIRDWNYLLSENSHAEIIFTRVLSGEELIDNISHRDRLAAKYPDSKGGEMEGVGLYSICEATKTDCILVKGICDFADGKKGQNKKHNQILAISSALDLCKQIFISDSVFKEINIFPYEEKNVFEPKDVSNILFELYDDNEKDKFYLERDQDITFNSSLNQFGIWIHGPSGCGKSNLIARNLINNDKEFILIDLSLCIGEGIQSLFDEIFYGIADKVSTTVSKPISFNDCSKKILRLLEEHYTNRNIVIFIEEIPISSDEEQKEFAEKLFSLLISKNFKKDLSKVKFVLSCIDNPKKYITPNQKKIHQQFTFLELNYWDETEIKLLIGIIFRELNFDLHENITNQLVKRAKGSPRFIKKFLRSAISLNKFDQETLLKILGETEREFI